MAPFEWLAIGYFLVVLTAAYRSSRPARGVFYVCGAVALVAIARFALPWAARVWLAHAYLILGYWIPAAFVSEPNKAFEAWLASWCGARAWHVRGTRGLLELAYLSCYPVVPAAFTAVFAYGSADDIVFFWVSTLGAGYVCYVTLPWTAARPPRLVDSERHALPHAVAAVNAAVLGRLSHQYVTFPSGHVAVAMAAALGVSRVWVEAGAAFGIVAVLIAIAAVAGRYHYAIDVFAGLLVGALMPLLSRFVV